MSVSISGNRSGVVVARKHAARKMRRSSGIPDADPLLCVRGAQVRPSRPPITENTRWGDRVVRLFPQEAPTTASEFSCTTASRPPGKPPRRVLPLHVADCRASASVRSGLLKQIHETVEVEDFRRLLRKLIRTRSGGEEDKRVDLFLSRKYVDSLHRELNRHMEVLRTLAEAQKDEEETTTNA